MLMRNLPDTQLLEDASVGPSIMGDSLFSLGAVDYLR